MGVDELKVVLDVARGWMKDKKFYVLLLAEFAIVNRLTGLLGIVFLTQSKATVFIPLSYQPDDAPIEAAKKAGWTARFQADPREIVKNVVRDLPKLGGKQRHIGVDPDLPPEGQLTLVGLVGKMQWFSIVDLGPTKEELRAKLFADN